MPTDSASPPPPTPSLPQPTYAWKIHNFSAGPAVATPGTLGTTWHANGSAGAGSSGVKKENEESVGEVSVQVPASNSMEVNKEVPSENPGTKRRKLNPEDEEVRNKIASAIAFSLATDHILTMYPDVDTPFIDEVDVVNRLLPYHVFQYPKQDISAMVYNSKGKAKATPEDLLREELRESKFAINCHKRFRSLEKRFRQARTRHGKYTAPHDQMIQLERMVYEGDRIAKTALDQELSSAKSELDRVLRAKRVAASNASRQAAQAQATQAASHLTASTSTSIPTPISSFYSYTTKPIMSSLQGTSFSHYYSSFTYPYTQTMPYSASVLSYPMNPNLTRNPAPVSALQPFATASAPPQTNATQTITTTSTTSTSTVTTDLSAVPAPTNGQTTSTSATSQSTSTRPPVTIPLSIPITSLPALRALGILPVPKAALPPPSEPQPAAVLIGSTAGGTMLSIEVNAALLQAPQMSGLAILLSGLVQMGGGNSSSGSSSAASTTNGTATTSSSAKVTASTPSAAASPGTSTTKSGVSTVTASKDPGT